MYFKLLYFRQMYAGKKIGDARLRLKLLIVLIFNFKSQVVDILDWLFGEKNL
jgi:hypothetical protein